MQFIGNSNKVSDAGKDRWAPSYQLQWGALIVMKVMIMLMMMVSKDKRAPSC